MRPPISPQSAAKHISLHTGGKVVNRARRQQLTISPVPDNTRPLELF